MWGYFIGLDLSAKEKNPTGIFIGDQKIIKTIVYKDTEIIDLISEFSPCIVSIDAPLSFKRPYRDGERDLIKLGFRPLPLSIKSMEELYRRAYRIKEKILEICSKNLVLETFPRAIEKILRFKYEIFKEYFKNKHEYDAWLCYINSKCFYFKRYVLLRDNIFLPKI